MRAICHYFGPWIHAIPPGRFWHHSLTPGAARVVLDHLPRCVYSLRPAPVATKIADVCTGCMIRTQPGCEAGLDSSSRKQETQAKERSDLTLIFKPLPQHAGLEHVLRAR